MGRKPKEVKVDPEPEEPEVGEEGEEEEGEEEEEEEEEENEGDEDEQGDDLDSSLPGLGGSSPFSDGNAQKRQKLMGQEVPQVDSDGRVMSKAERRKERNRLAAQRSRMRKNEKIKELSSRSKTLKEIGDDLVRERDALLEEIRHLETLVVSHGKITCQSPKGMPAPFPLPIKLLSVEHSPLNVPAPSFAAEPPKMGGSLFPAAPINPRNHDPSAPSTSFPSFLEGLGFTPSLSNFSVVSDPTPLPPAAPAQAPSQRVTRSRHS